MAPLLAGQEKVRPNSNAGPSPHSMSLSTLRHVRETNAWKALAESVVAGTEVLPSSTEDFATYWIEAGHHIREQIADDRLLSRLLRASLPPYVGGAVELYRGENLGRWQVGALGFAWTASRRVAEMFAGGLNAVGSGGVLLQTTCSQAAVIAGPTQHSNYLGEDQFTVEPALVRKVGVLKTYSPT